VSEKVDQILGHGADCDGIEEYDNKLPTWWLGLFYFCILWAGGYAVHYHFVATRSQTSEYEAEIAAAAIAWPMPEAPAGGVAGTPTAADIEAGKAIYTANCVGCHGPELKGGIGPDLTDGEWIHGGTLTEITKTVTEGVPAKGMLTWGPILGPQKVASVSAFIHSSGGGK
jgi:cytochrome c oxidase cbb3-type subunit 3